MAEYRFNDHEGGGPFRTRAQLVWARAMAGLATAEVYPAIRLVAVG